MVDQFRTRHCGRAALTAVCLLLALFLAVPAAPARDTGGGNQGGDGGRIKKIELIFFKKTPFHRISALMDEVRKNWNHRYKLTLPNSTPSTNTAIIKLARTDPTIATDVIISILRSTRKNTRKLLLKYIREYEANIAHQKRALKNKKNHSVRWSIEQGLKIDLVALERLKELRLTLRVKKRR